MKFTTQILVAIAASCFSITTLAGPLEVVQVRSSSNSGQQMTPADRHILSGQDYTSWSKSMVDSGKMHWPDKNSKRDLVVRGPNWSVKSAACGFIGGTHDSFAEGEAKFCGLIRNTIGATLQGATWILQDGVCEDNEACVLIIDISMGIGGSFLADQIPSVCETLFEAVWNDCSGTGGSAELTVGAETGSIQAQFFVRDSGATCPADTATNVCQQSSF